MLNQKVAGEATNTNRSLQKAVSLAMTNGHQLSKEAFDFLQETAQTRDPTKLMEEIIKRIDGLSEKPMFIDRELLEEVIKEIRPTNGEAKRLSSELLINGAKRGFFFAYARNIDSEIKVIDDPTEKIAETGSMEEYIKLFRDRFRKLKRLLRCRMDSRDAIPISEALKFPINSKVKTIGIIGDKWENKERLFLTIEDLEANATVLVPKSVNREVLKKAQYLLPDSVVCVSVVKGKGGLLIAKDFILPEIPMGRPNKASVPVYAVLTSDLHVGSKLFMYKAFNRFLLWLNGRFGNNEMMQIASHVKYVLIAGDLVDGIGVYPNQGMELDIADIYHQYRALSKLIEQIPDHIELIIIPGNHDASRRAMPQPAISHHYLEPLHKARKIYSLGNPSTVTLHKVRFLLYHGRSLDDIVATVPNLTFRTPNEAMKILLQNRHLAPIYGQKTPIAPEKQDLMVIEGPPDIFHVGHVHILEHNVYRGTLMVNSGTWQEQTNFQRKMGLIPTPGIVPVVNLQTLNVTTLNFIKPSM